MENARRCLVLDHENGSPEDMERSKGAWSGAEWDWILDLDIGILGNGHENLLRWNLHGIRPPGLIRRTS